MNRALIVKDVGDELYKRGFDVYANDTQMELGLPGLLIIVDAASCTLTHGWIWRRYGHGKDVALGRIDEEDIDHNAVYKVDDVLSGDATRSRKAGVKSMLLVLRDLLSGYQDVLMADHIEHVKEQASLGKGGMTEDEMASLGLLDIEGVRSLDEALKKVEEVIKET